MRAYKSDINPFDCKFYHCHQSVLVSFYIKNIIIRCKIANKIPKYKIALLIIFAREVQKS